MQQGIAWASGDPDLCRHVASLGHNELTHWRQGDVVIILSVILKHMLQIEFMSASCKCSQVNAFEHLWW